MHAEPINESNLYLFHQGTQTRAFTMFGAQLTELDGQAGTRFAAAGVPSGAAKAGRDG